MKKTGITSIAASLAFFAMAQAQTAEAKQLTQDEVVKVMVGKPITTRTFGVRVNLRFESSGVVTAKSIIGNYKGRWRRGKGDAICTTFKSGPAAGTQCNTYRALGGNRYRTSSGTTFSVN